MLDTVLLYNNHCSKTGQVNKTKIIIHSSPSSSQTVRHNFVEEMICINASNVDITDSSSYTVPNSHSSLSYQSGGSSKSNSENLSVSNTANVDATTVNKKEEKSTAAPRKGIKTVYLIRHAESNENRRRNSLNRCFEQISTGAIPSKADLNASFELLNVPAQLNSDVSEIGARQIKHMGERLQSYNFLEKNGVQLVVHSPLIRARQTCEGLLGCVANKPNEDLPACVQRVEELDFLVERQPQEIPQDVILKDVSPAVSSFAKRIQDFEEWLVKQREDTIAVVGHSLHFKSMLKVPFKFQNCEVWVAHFDPQRIVAAKQRRRTLLMLPPIPQNIQQMNIFKSQLVSPVCRNDDASP